MNRHWWHANRSVCLAIYAELMVPCSPITASNYNVDKTYLSKNEIETQSLDVSISKKSYSHPFYCDIARHGEWLMYCCDKLGGPIGRSKSLRSYTFYFVFSVPNIVRCGHRSKFLAWHWASLLGTSKTIGSSCFALRCRQRTHYITRKPKPSPVGTSSSFCLTDDCASVWLP